jgi:photosystem II stability/assembly factor-like uncharacterized protein
MKGGGLKMMILMLLFFSLNFGHCFADEVWRDLTKNLDTDLYSIAVSPDNGDIIYVGSDKSIFRTLDGGENWNYIYTVKGEGQKINFILFDPQDGNKIYFATDNGLFKSSDNGKTFQKIFRGKSELERAVAYVAKAGDGFLYLGTQNGLFRSLDEGVIWSRLSGIPRDSSVTSINLHSSLPNLIYVVCDSGVYKSFDKGVTWERVFVAQKKEESTDEEEDSEEPETSQLILRSLVINSFNPQMLYLGTTKGLFISQDAGKNWEKKTIANLGEVEIRYIVSFDRPEVLYIATNRGVFKITLNKSEAQEIYQDIPTHDVRMVALDKEEKVWAVTDKGLFKTVEVERTEARDKDVSLNEYELYFRGEPTIQEVQAEAIRYAEVHPEKIKQWRIQARMKAFVPEFDLDYDKTINWYSTQQRYYIGPRAWSVGLSWDLADLVWSTDQTSIDVRSRLMVQLRDDVLDEVNRLFFERRRLKLVLLLQPPTDIKERLEKQLRLEELTAGLDVLTGGYFSRRLKELTR